MDQFRQDIWKSRLSERMKQLVKDKPSGSQDKQHNICGSQQHY